MRLERTMPEAPSAAAALPPPAAQRGAAPRSRGPHEAPPRPAVRRPVQGRRRPFERETESPFRRRQVRWRRRPKLLAWARRIAATLAIAGMPVAAVVWLLTSERFALSELEVVIGEPGAARPPAARPDGEPRVSEAWVRQQLEPFVGENLLRLELAAVAERLERHPWVRAAEVSKELPARLRVRVSERREAALLRAGDALVYLDAAGRPIAAADPGADAAGDLVVVRRRPPPPVPAAGPESLGAALELLRELEAADLAWLADLEQVEILGEGDFRVSTAGLPFPLLVKAGTVEKRVRRLEGLLPQLVERYGSGAVLDLRFERRIIVEPSPRGPAGEPAALPGAAAGGTQRRGDSG